MKKFIILLILFLPSIALAEYPLQIDTSDVQGIGHFSIELGARVSQNFDDGMYYGLQADFGLDLGITNWADIGLGFDYSLTNRGNIEHTLSPPTFFIQILPLEKYLKDFAIRVDYSPTKGHDLGAVFIKTFKLQEYSIDINLGSFAKDISIEPTLEIFSGIALNSQIDGDFLQFSMEVVYVVNPLKSDHTLSSLLALVFGEKLVAGVGIDYSIDDILKWYLVLGARFGY